MSINDINSELDSIKSSKSCVSEVKGINNILQNNIKNIEEFMDRKIINIYCRPWNKLEKKLKKIKVTEFIERNIENNECSQEEGLALIKSLFKDIDSNKKIKVKYNVEECFIESITYS